MLKGVAILMMVFLHLFNHADLTSSLKDLVYIQGRPLVFLLSTGCTPVAFFLILSGYGQSYVYQNGGMSLGSQIRRLLRLYIHYWVILFVFVSIGHFVRPESYPGSWGKIIGNFSSYLSSYNYETWFLLPYALISLSAGIYFRVMAKTGRVWFALCSFMAYLAASYAISRYIAPAKAYESIWSLLCSYLSMLFSFTLGVLLHQHGKRTTQMLSGCRKSVALIGIILLFSAKCFIHTDALNPLYALVFILLFLQIPVKGHLRDFLLKMGQYSMPVWMIHSYFCYYLFQSFTYSLRYPFLIFIFVMGMSCLCAIPIMRISQWIIRRLSL